MADTSSSLMSRMMLALRAGLQFGGARDLYQVYGYNRAITEKMMYDKYSRQDVASSVIDKPASALWTNPPLITINEKSIGSDWDNFVHKHQLWSKLLRADKLLGMESYVVLYLGAPGNAETPFKKGTDIAFIQVFGGTNATISSYITDPNDPRYGYPEFYSMQLGAQVSNVKTLKVHHSRIIHLTNELLDSNYLSAPRMLRGYNILEDILKVAGGSAETFWLTANRGTQVDVDKDMELGAGDLAALNDEIEEYQHQLRRVIRTRGVKVTTLGSDVADPSGVFSVSISLLASTYKIPQRILMGAEAGQLASEQDRANWATSVEERRESFAEPYVLLPILDKLQAYGVIKQLSGIPTFEWPEAFRVSPLERGQTMAQIARAVGNFSRQTQLGNPILTTDECRAVIGHTKKEDLPTVEEAMQWFLDSKKTSATEASNAIADTNDPVLPTGVDKQGTENKTAN